MRTLIYDFEVFKYDWLVVFKDHDTHNYSQFHNDSDGIKEFLHKEDILVGFNNKHYDQHILKGTCMELSPEQIKKINDFLIQGGQGWQHPVLKEFFFDSNQVDVMDDMQVGQSLKSIEGHLGMNIEESEVDFNIDHPLTPEELERTFHYCRADVDATEEIFNLRKNYFANKIQIGKLAGIDAVKAMGMTNAKLTAAMLKAKKKPHDDERNYQYPENLKEEFIPAEVFQYFGRMKDPDIPDEEVFGEKLEIKIGKCPVTIGFGGIHGAIPNYIWEAGR